MARRGQAPYGQDKSALRLMIFTKFGIQDGWQQGRLRPEIRYSVDRSILSAGSAYRRVHCGLLILPITKPKAWLFPMRKLVSQLIIRSKKATPQQLAQLVDQARVAPFADDLLEVDEPLWGGFWQGDVIAPGYRLPAAELALLRAMRLDTTWPEGTSVAQFLADLHWATSQPQAGVWTLAVAGEPCVVFAAPFNVARSMLNVKPLATVVWYCATTERLHAGYRAAIDSLSFVGAVEQRPPNFIGARHFEPFDYAQDRSASHLESVNQSSWLKQILDQDEIISGQRSAACPELVEWVGGRRSAFGDGSMVLRDDGTTACGVSSDDRHIEFCRSS